MKGKCIPRKEGASFSPFYAASGACCLFSVYHLDGDKSLVLVITVTIPEVSQLQKKERFTLLHGWGGFSPCSAGPLPLVLERGSTQLRTAWQKMPAHLMVTGNRIRKGLRSQQYTLGISLLSGSTSQRFHYSPVSHRLLANPLTHRPFGDTNPTVSGSQDKLIAQRRKSGWGSQ